MRNPLNQPQSRPPASLRPFARRVRLVRAWRGLAIGASVGGGLAAAWAVLDWTNVLYADWRSLGILFGAMSGLGAVVGLLWPVSAGALARSLDHRARLEDRLVTAAERTGTDGPFDASLREDAVRSLESVRPKVAYPVRFGRWQGAAGGLGLLAAAIFLLGNSPFLMNGDARRTRDALHQQGEKVERIARENFETPEAKREMSEDEKKLADQLHAYQKDLDKGRMTDEQSLERSDDLAKQADDLMRKTAKQSEQSLDSAQQALDQMERDELANAGMPDADPTLAQMPDDQLSQMTQDAQARLDSAQRDVSAAQSAMDSLMQKLNDPKMSKAEREALEAQKKALEKKLSDARDTLDKAKKDLAALQASKEAQDLMRRIAANPLYKQIQDLLKKMRNNADAVQSGDRPQITAAQREEMRRKLNDLIAKLKDQKNLDAYLKAMLDALQKSGKMGRCNGLCVGLGNLVPRPGTGAPGNSVMLTDIGKVNHSATALPSEGTTQETQVSGMSRPSADPAPYIEIRAPATMGNRSAVPYVKVLPSYRRKAESAIDRQQIPKEDEKRVRAYFESLGK